MSSAHKGGIVMALQTKVQLRDTIEQRLQDTGNATWLAAELDIYMADALREMAEYVPYERKEVYTVVNRAGNDTAGTSSKLTDTNQSPFVAGDVGRNAWNDTDRTWALINVVDSSSVLTLDRDIFDSNEAYKIFNKGCWAANQINLGDLGDGLWAKGKRSIRSVEYPVNKEPLRFRSWKMVDRDILEIDTTQTIFDTYEVNIVYYARHRLSVLTDLVGATTAVVAAGATSVPIDAMGTTEVVEADTEFSIAGVRGTYRVLADVTMSSSAGTIACYPPIQAAAAENDVVTFVQSSLTPTLERIFVEMVAARALMEKSHIHLNTVNVGGARAWADFASSGERKLALALSELRSIATIKPNIQWPRGE